MAQRKSRPITEDLPPEKLLETNDHRLIRAGVTCMHDIDTIRRYVAYENAHEQRSWVCRILQERADEVRTES